MTPDEVGALPAGPELDALVAERVFLLARVVRARGSDATRPVWTDNPAICDGAWTTGELERYGAPAPYSTDIAAAWEVARWLRERWWGFTLAAGLEWHCYADEAAKSGTWGGGAWGSGLTPELAICRAALLEVTRNGEG
jgi:hypothetical protein